MSKLTGVALTAVSGAAFGSMSILTKFVYAEGVTPTSLLLLRFSIASLCLLPLLWWQKLPLPRGKQLLAFIFMGGVLYTAEAQAFFIALKYASAGLVGLLLYLFPALVMLLSALLFKEKITRRKLLALSLASLGLIVTIGFDVSGQPLGIALGVLAAMLYAVYSIIGEKFGGRTHPIAAAFVVMASAAVCHIGLVAIQGWHPPQTASGWSAMVAIAILCTVIAIICYLAGIAIIGATQAALVSTVEPIVTLVLAALVLGEVATPMQWLGGGLIIAGVIVLTLKIPIRRAILNEIHD